MRNKRIQRYRGLFFNSLNRKVYVVFYGKYNSYNRLYGKIIKIRKTSMRILLDDESKINVGFAHIKESIFIDTCLRLKLNLYYGVNKPKIHKQ